MASGTARTSAFRSNPGASRPSAGSPTTTLTASGTTVWNPFAEDSAYFAPSESRLMINYRVPDLHALLAVLRSEGCTVDDKVEESEYGKFGWVMDPEGNRIELWQPPAGS